MNSINLAAALIVVLFRDNHTYFFICQISLCFFPNPQYQAYTGTSYSYTFGTDTI